MHFDCSKMLAGLGAGVVLTSPTGDTVQYVLQILYTDSNNAAEYEALLHALVKKDTSVTFWAERIFFLSYV